MGFWGIEVKPGKKVSPFGDAANALGRLRITQATLGLGSSGEKSILQCFGEQKIPIFLCALLPDKIESCSLDLEFDEDDSVTFSVLGSRSIHLSGYFLEEDEADAEDDCCGFDHAAEMSSDYDSEDASVDDFSDDDDSYSDDDDSYSGDDRFSTIPKSGVVIEEIMDDDKAADGHSQSKQQKKNKGSNSVEDPKQGQIVPRNSASVAVLESEDEDGFPTSKVAPQQKSPSTAPHPNKEATEKVQKKKKRDAKTIEQDDLPDGKKKRKKQKKIDSERNNDKKTSDCGTAAVTEDPKKAKEVVNREADEVLPQEPPKDNNENQTEKKKKKKNKNKKSQEAGDQDVKAKSEKSESTVSKEKPSQVRTFPNGLVVEEIKMGKPDGKRAAPGKKVSVHYIGKLEKNGKIFDSNVGSAPFKFRLGIGEVIKGWDVGVNGMRVGDKRRLKIPPAMGYGAKGAGGTIPPNAWLVFDVELVDVR